MTKPTKAEFKKTATKIVALAEIAASFTPTNKDDQVVALLGGLITDPEKFDQLCELLDITE